jgi:hypothetical protein
LIYQGALDLPKDDPASAIEALIRTNDRGKELLKRLREKIGLPACYLSSRRATNKLADGSPNIFGGER